jgi:AraC-like DNA-binding protein
MVLAAVPGLRLNRLRPVDTERYSFHPVASWGEAIDAIRHQPVELAVADPLMSGGPGIHEMERIRAYFPSLPMLVYTTLSAESANVLLALGRLGIRRALFAGLDDSAAALRLALQDELEHTVAQRVLRDVSAVLRGMPDHLRWVLDAALRQTTRPVSVGALAEQAQVERRTCQRWLAKAGLPGPKTVMMLARLLYAHRLLGDPGYTVEDVALKLGYGTARTLQTHFREVFGLTAGELRLSMSPEAALERVTGHYFGAFRQVAS